MRHLRQMEKALKVFHKARAKLQRTMDQVTKEMEDCIERRNREIDTEEKLKDVWWKVEAVHSKISNLLGEEVKNDAT